MSEGIGTPAVLGEVTSVVVGEGVSEGAADRPTPMEVSIGISESVGAGVVDTSVGVGASNRCR